MRMTSCAAAARAPFPMSRARKLVFYQRVDKETFVEELEALKHAVADQAYHFQLHRVHIHQLRAQHQSVPEPLNFQNPHYCWIDRFSHHATWQSHLNCWGRNIPQCCSRLEEKLAAIESIDGSNAPRTGGASRLSSKVAGLCIPPHLWFQYHRWTPRTFKTASVRFLSL